MRKRKKLCEIKIYEMNTDGKFYRAESNGISYPSKSIKACVDGLLKDLKDLDYIR